MKKMPFALAAVLSAIAVFAGAEKPVRIGIMSDTHIGAKGNDVRLEKAYGLFKKFAVDRIFNIGDICHNHDAAMFAKYVEIRTRVYGDRLPPETYVYANHDCSGAKIAGDDRERSKAFAVAKEALKIPNERYDSFEVAGCRFLVFPQYRDDRRVEEMLVKAAAEGPRPIFVLDHVPPAWTVDCSGVGGNPTSRRLYNRFPQVVTFSGHTHSPLCCEGNIWQDEFTAIGFGTLFNSRGSKGRSFVAVMELTSRQAVIRRYDVDTGAELAPERPWTLRFPYDRANAPYGYARRSKAEGAPSFPPEAKVTVRHDAQNGDFVVSFPKAERAWYHDVDARVEKDGAWKCRSKVSRVYDGSVRFSEALFDAGEKVRFAVRPIGQYRDEGTAIACDCRVEKGTPWKTLYAGVPAPAKAGEWLDFRGATWFTLPEAAMAVPAGTPMRFVLDVETDMKPANSLSFNLRPRPTADYAYGYIHTPFGSTALRYAKSFRRPDKPGLHYDLLMNSSNWTPFAGRVKINQVRIECR